MRYRLLCTFLLLALSACASVGDRLQNSDIGFKRDAPTVAPSAYRNLQWQVLLAATGNEEDVFDRFTTDFAARLKGQADIAQVTILSANKDIGPESATLPSLRQGIAKLKPRDGQACLIYLTGHGTPSGLVMSAHKPKLYLTPDMLDKMLAPCASQPSVIVISACYSGVFMREGIAKANRIVLTASSEERPSFGCSNNYRYTFFDQCFIDSWPRAATFEGLSDEIKACVTRSEAAITPPLPSSNPQSFFGRQMRALPLPARNTSQLISPGTTAWNLPSR